MGRDRGRLLTHSRVLLCSCILKSCWPALSLSPKSPHLPLSFLSRPFPSLFLRSASSLSLYFHTSRGLPVIIPQFYSLQWSKQVRSPFELALSYLFFLISMPFLTVAYSSFCSSIFCFSLTSRPLHSLLQMGEVSVHAAPIKTVARIKDKLSK